VPQFFGKYRGNVVNNVDPEELGRVQVSVPSVRGEGSLAWAMPCVPYAGPGVGLFLVPPVGACVWVEFEGGDPDSPIVAGCFWSEGQVPVSPAVPTTRAFVSEGVSLVIEAVAGGSVTLSISEPITPRDVTLVIDDNGMLIETGDCKLEIGATEIKLNGDALVVR
jgi:hypothetical protein